MSIEGLDGALHPHIRRRQQAVDSHKYRKKPQSDRQGSGETNATSVHKANSSSPGFRREPSVVPTAPSLTDFQPQESSEQKFDDAQRHRLFGKLFGDSRPFPRITVSVSDETTTLPEFLGEEDAVSQAG